MRFYRHPRSINALFNESTLVRPVTLSRQKPSKKPKRKPRKALARDVASAKAHRLKQEAKIQNLEEWIEREKKTQAMARENAALAKRADELQAEIDRRAKRLSWANLVRDRRSKGGYANNEDYRSKEGGCWTSKPISSSIRVKKLGLRYILFTMKVRIVNYQ